MSLFFSLIESHFYMHFYLPFQFFNVPFDFFAVQKPAFCKAKAHRGKPKEGNMSLLFFSNGTAFFYAF